MKQIKDAKSLAELVRECLENSFDSDTVRVHMTSKVHMQVLLQDGLNTRAFNIHVSKV